jgi:hypothetical protein
MTKTSIKDEFEAEDWEQISNLPALVAAAVISGDLSSLPGLIEEGKALYTTLAAARSAPEANPLAQAAAAEILARRDDLPEPVKQPDGGAALEDLYARIGESLLILQPVVDPAITTGFRKWLYTVAEATAEAARETGLLGFSGPRVSAREKEVLDRLAHLLA